MPSGQDLFSEIDRRIEREGIEPALTWLGDHLRQAGNYHQLFDARLMQARHRLGLPVGQSANIDDLPEPSRTALENAYLDACREVGSLLLESGRLREAWMYLRPAGEKQLVASHLAKFNVDEENLEQIIEIALHEGVEPVLGYQLVLSNFGTCNAITMFDSVAYGRSKAERRALAALLVQHVHKELTASVRADIERREGTAPPADATVASMVEGRPQLFAELNYHLDSSHLAATVRVARLVEDRDVLALATDLTEYGRRLDKTYQYAGEPPFGDLYPASALFFRAQLGIEVEEALRFFKKQSEAAAEEDAGIGPAEVYVALLARLGRISQAIEASAEFIPAGANSSGFAPSLMELAALGNDHERVAAVFQMRDDLINYAAARSASQQRGAKSAATAL